MQKLIKFYLSIVLSFFIFSCNEITTKGEKNLSLAGSEDGLDRQPKKKYLKKAEKRLEALKFDISTSSLNNSAYVANDIAIKCINDLILIVKSPNTSLIDSAKIIAKIIDNINENVEAIQFFSYNSELGHIDPNTEIEFHNPELFNLIKEAIDIIYDSLEHTNSNRIKINSLNIKKEDFEKYPKKSAFKFIFDYIFKMFNFLQAMDFQEALNHYNLSGLKSINDVYHKIKTIDLALIKEADNLIKKANNSTDNKKTKKRTKKANPENPKIEELESQIKKLESQIKKLESQNSINNQEKIEGRKFKLNNLKKQLSDLRSQ